VLPEAEIIDWLFAVYQWLLTNFDGYEAFSQTPLVTPTDEFFPIQGLEGEALGDELFQLVLQYAGLEQWSCRLEIIGHITVGDTMRDIPHDGIEDESPGGTFEVGPASEAIIRYREDMLDNPVGLVATLAHELSHYLIATTGQSPPGGEEAYEPATDVGAVFMGFGIFMANAAFVYEKFSDLSTHGWRVGSQGYLSEEELSYALAIFSELLDIDPRQVRRHLDPNPRSYYKAALKDLKRRSSQLDDLRSIPPGMD
jgi:hypothetical protein